MSFAREHELHLRRRRRNAWVGAVLGAFVLLVFGITIVKLASGQKMEGFDHSFRPSLTEEQK